MRSKICSHIISLRDKEIIEKLKLNSEGKYNCFTKGDVEYIEFTIHRCAKLEEEIKKLNNKIPRNKIPND